MKIYYPPDLVSDLNQADLFFDTTALIASITFPKELSDFFKKLTTVNCTFLTIPSVLFEFTRGVDTIAGFNNRTTFLHGMISAIYPIERHLNEFRDLIVVLQRVRGKMSYTDFLLCCCLYKFPKAYLVSENHNDMPLEVLDRNSVLTIDKENEIRNWGIYKFSFTKYEIAAENILKR